MLARVHSVQALLASLGGVATYAELASVLPRRRIARAVADGELVRCRRGRYVSPATAQGRELAHRLTATLSHESAALHHGWPVRLGPDQPHVIVRRQRHLLEGDRERVVSHYRELAPGDVTGGVTTPLRTVLDCARDLSFDRALAVADSALRSGAVSQEELRRAVEALPARMRGKARARKVVGAATPLAAGPIESVLRANVIDLPGFAFVPQVTLMDLELYATPDLCDLARKVALEAEGYAFHGGRREFLRDCTRYDDLVAFGWTVFRYGWEHVMFQPRYVRWCLESWLARHESRIPPPRPTGLGRVDSSTRGGGPG